MKLNDAVEILKAISEIIKGNQRVCLDEQDAEAIDTVVEEEIVPTQKICQKCGSELINTEQYGWFCPDIACRIEGQNQHLNNTTYTAEDMESFAEWCNDCPYALLADGKWSIIDDNVIVTTAQLREMWEQEMGVNTSKPHSFKT